MSAVRRSERRATRNVHSSPYARPRAPSSKKSMWSLSGLLGYFNPLRFRSSKDADELESTSDMDSSEDDSKDSIDPHEYVAQQRLPDEPLIVLHGEEQELPPSPPLPAAPTSPAQTLSARGRQMAQNLNFGFSEGGPSTAAHVPYTPARNSPIVFNLNTPPSHMASSFSHRQSLAQNLEPVTKFLVEKAGQPLNEFEAAGIVEYIQKNVQNDAEKAEPFRFSTTPSRDASPIHGFGSSTNGIPAQTPRRTLSKNPNGVYKWQGAGSARPRNRYQSPGFGSRPTPSRIKISPPKTPQTDTKRRRVGEAAETSTSQRAPASPTPLSRSQAPVPSPTRITQSQPMVTPAKPTVNGKTTNGPFPVSTNKLETPRLRTNGLPIKPTLPAVPSPLRQAWGQSDSPPSNSPPTRPTKAANFMTELIKEVTPPKKADVSNPYQTASPVKPPPKKQTAKKLRSTRSTEQKQTEKEKAKEPELSTQAIIEATVPKGSKRARPPPELETSASAQPSETATSPPKFPGSPPRRSPRNQASDLPPVNGSAGLGRSLKPAPTLQIEEEDNRIAKKPKITGVYGTPRRPRAAAVTVEEIDDVEMPSSPQSTSPVTKPSEVIEPEDESRGSQPVRPSNASGTPAVQQSTSAKSLFGVKSSAPKEPSKLRFSYQVDKVETVSEPKISPPISTPQASPPLKKVDLVEPSLIDPKSAVLAMDVDSLPTYTFTLGGSPYDAGPSHVKARESAKLAPLSSLPTFDFSKPTTAVNGFNWTAAGMKAPTAASKPGSWTCSTCMLTNSDDAKDKCSVCEEPRNKSTPTHTTNGFNGAASTTNGFNWAAAGVKQPSKGSGGDAWTCSTCMLSNPASATEQCTVCEAPRSKPATSSGPAKGFDWTAAGMKQPSKTSGGATWTCSTCMLSNPASAKDKCTVCDTPR